MKRTITVAIVAALALAPLAGCRRAPQEINFGVLPIVDALPFFVAEAKGYFEAEGVKVSLVNFRSAAERDTALTGGQIDGHLGDVISSALLVQAGVKARIASLLLGQTPAEGRIAILASPKSKAKSLSDLAGVPIAISTNSMIEYVVDRLLQGAGFSAEEVAKAKTSVPSIPTRFQMLMAGQIEAAALPDPLASLAERMGAKLIADDSRGDNLSQSIILFREDAIERKARAIQRFLRAYDRAVADINADPDAFKDLLESKAALPAAVKESFRVPPFPKHQLPGRAEVEPVLAWLKGKGLVKADLTYDKITTSRFTGR